MDDLEPEPPVGEREDLVGRRRPAEITARVGNDDDLELEPLRGVDREEAHSVGALFLGHGLELRGAEGLLVAQEADEALEVAAPNLLIGAREPHQLAEVRVPAAAVPAREHRQVVVVAGDDELAEPLERRSGRSGDEPLVALLERAHEALVALGECDGQRALDPGEERPSARMPADQHEAVVRDADERRGEHGRQRLVVVAVAKEPQVHEQVDDLLLAEVAPAGCPVGGKVERAELLLVQLRVGSGGEQEHDLPRRRGARVDELTHAARDRAGLRPAPVLTRLAVGLLVGQEQLDRVPEHGVGELARRGERLVAVAELLAEDVVDRGEHLGTRAVVLGQREALLGRRAPLAEDADVGVPEPVDRLELVTDEEHLLRGPAAEQVDHLALERVRVLELVDHDPAEAQLLGLEDASVPDEQVAGEELEILEVERRLALLAGLVLGCEEVEQLLQERLVAGCDQLERRLLDVLASLLEGRGPRTPGPERREVDQRVGKRGKIERSLGRGDVILGRARVLEQALRGTAQVAEAAVEVCRVVRARASARVPPSGASRTRP